MVIRNNVSLIFFNRVMYCIIPVSRQVQLLSPDPARYDMPSYFPSHIVKEKLYSLELHQHVPPLKNIKGSQSFLLGAKYGKAGKNL
jgi:hypothetical protein